MGLTQRLRAALDAFQGKAMPDIYGAGGMTQLQYRFGEFGESVTKRELVAAYRSWVYACVNIRASAVSAAVFRLYVRQGPDDFEEIADHPISMLLDDFNPMETKGEVLRRTIAHLDLTGDAYWYLPKTRLGVPAEIWVLPTEKVRIVPSKETFISHYELRHNTQQTIRFEPEEIVHFKYPDPTDQYYGVSPLRAAWTSYAIDQRAHEYQENFYENSALIPTALTTDQKLSDASYKRVKEQWAKQYAGAANAGKTPVLDGGLKLQTFGINPKDLDWLATTKATRDDILAMYGVPASKLGLVEDVNRANAEANDYTFSANVIEPILTMIDERLTQDLARRIDPRLFIRHDSTIRQDDQLTANVAKIRISTGMTTINEERQAEGYDAVEGGDVILVPNNLVPLTQAVKEPEPVPPQLEPAAVPPEEGNQ